ncbi:hypothetical protein BpHYR1_052809 [Brachionus plicatilis]|uniref:Uncharacterized protein n=1 Tax=Brachionus plicatilis TaxID=10195 RepID=A0A3M7R0G5_BRAPC|nr:hypothetical protein BpHYR1_052809 [Brachionus plicatilis]
MISHLNDKHPKCLCLQMAPRQLNILHHSVEIIVMATDILFRNNVSIEPLFFECWSEKIFEL